MGKVRDKLAFGVFGSDREYLLSRAKFPVMAEEIARLAERLGRAPRVLDAGIGRARLERLFRLQYPEVDIEWHAVDRVDRRLRIRDDIPGIHRARAAVEALPYADGTFDAVVCCWVLQHLVDPDAAVRELVRVLAPEGLLLLAVPSGPTPIQWSRKWVHPFRVWQERRRGRTLSYLPQIQFYSLPRLRRIVRAAGADPVRWQGIAFVTGGPLRFLEDHEWYYRWNLRAGARLPRLTKNLVCAARKSAAAAGPPSGPDPRSRRAARSRSPGERSGAR